MSLVKNVFNSIRTKQKGHSDRYGVIILAIAAGTATEADGQELAGVVNELGYTEADVEADVAGAIELLAAQRYANGYPERAARHKAVCDEFSAAEASLKAAQERRQAAFVAWQNSRADTGESKLSAAKGRIPRVLDGGAYLEKRRQQPPSA